MALAGSRSLLSKLCLVESVAKRAAVPCLPALQRRAAGGKADPSDAEEDDKPYVYSKSKAAEWKAAQTFRPPAPLATAARRAWSRVASWLPSASSESRASQDHVLSACDELTSLDTASAGRSVHWYVMCVSVAVWSLHQGHTLVVYTSGNIACNLDMCGLV
ncbi:uncharacterized protein LOC119453781 isoform X1 [Dermacentor silvarum]|uniref:uncharacterized protein LOC119453781 isoform X1 n=1 Tax=Dermacentor silvarum TaxID=543639 RepID=UPI00210162D5|nr:uncharacterized protein LOC119453781 isoform X1 [Dermacentor silvarum]